MAKNKINPAKKKKVVKAIVKAAYYPKTSNTGMSNAFGDKGSRSVTSGTREGIKNIMKKIKSNKKK